MKDPVLHMEDGSEKVLPFKWEICSHCEGHSASSNYLGAFTGDQWAEMDDEWKEDYRNGRYDRACEHCQNGKVKVVDEDKVKPEELKLFYEQEEESHAMHEIERQERLMEGGWREEGWYGE